MRKKFVHSFMVLALFIATLLVAGCKKEAAPVDPQIPAEESQIPFVYDSLYISGKVALYQSCTVVAVASGKDLSFSWELDLGTILGSGSSVTFNACCPGDHNVTCTVTDGYGNSQSKGVSIFVPE